MPIIRFPGGATVETDDTEQTVTILRDLGLAPSRRIRRAPKPNGTPAGVAPVEWSVKVATDYLERTRPSVRDLITALLATEGCAAPSKKVAADIGLRSPRAIGSVLVASRNLAGALGLKEPIELRRNGPRDRNPTLALSDAARGALKEVVD